MHTTYTGARVRLRPFTSGEEAYHLLARVNRNINPYWGEMWGSELGQIREFESNGYMDAKEVCCFAVDRLDTGELVGFEVAVPQCKGPLVGEVGTFIDPKHQRQGFGVEAKQLCMCFMFDYLPLNQILGITIENHAPARRGLELCGMKYFGSKRKVVFSKGKWRDVEYYRMWRKDWEGHPIHGILRRGN